MRRITLLSATMVASLATLTTVLFAGSCGTEQEPSPAKAFVIDSRSQLIGGPTALGDVGDYKLENGKIRAIIQDKTFNRGAGVFGGSLIDADIVHATDEGNALGGSGNDSFGEMFPAFFLEMIDPQAITVVNDGSDGTAAIVEVRGQGGEFVTMLRYLNQLLVNSYKEPSKVVSDILAGNPPDSDSMPNLEFTTRYILEPGARHIRIESTMQNISFLTLQFPPREILAALAGLAGLDLGDFRLPMGHVLGFGKLSKIFLPGLGYDIELGLRDAAAESVPLPAFPGYLTPVVASTNTHGVNYGFATADNPDVNFVYQRDTGVDEDGNPLDLYGGRAKPDDMLYLFNASGFGGVFTSQAPERLAPSHCVEGADPVTACEKFEDNAGRCVAQWSACLAAREEIEDSFTYVNYLIIGDGDVASIMEEYYAIRGTETFPVRGRVVDETTGSAVDANDSVLIYETSGSCDDATILNQAFILTEGRFEFGLPVGSYCARTQGEGRPLGDMVPFEVTSNGTGFLHLSSPSSGRIVARVAGEDGVPLPAKLTAVAVHDYVEGSNYREFLMDQVAGEPWRPTDFVPDDPNDAQTRRYIEDMAYGSSDGIVALDLRPGTYTVYLSRGPEYGLFSKDVVVAPGGTHRVSATLERVVDTAGYVSGDFHMHAAGSIDSGLDFNKRVISIAAEGVESVVSTEHNYISDFSPYIYRNELQPFLKSTIGLELTTFEAGHFNGFPVRRTLKSMNRGSFAWQDIPPDQIFAEMRDMAPDGQENIIQVNHPRTPILGYFEQHNVSPFDTSVTLPIEGASGFSADTLASPNGSQFIERSERADGTVEYSPTFSWAFDAIEIFNGPHLEELRHFRMPFNKDATAGAPDALPDAVRDGLRAQYIGEMTDTELREVLAEYVVERDEIEPTDENIEAAESDIEALSEAARAELVDEWVQAQIPEQYAILCDADSIVHSGALDDWYNILNYNRPDGTYQRYTATGNSDSHGDHLDPPGLPRNYYQVSHDDPAQITDAELVEAVQNQRNLVSNGPFANMTVNGEAVGSELSATGTVEVEVTIRAADWVGADRFRLVGNGEVVRDLDPAQSDDFWGWVPIELDGNGEFTATYSVPVDRDTWYVLEVESDQNMFPVYSPQDIPPFNFSDVIGDLAASFGFGFSVPGLTPEFTFPITGFAFTNPIWVVADGDGEFTPPSPPSFECVEGEYVLSDSPANALVAPETLEAARNGRLKAASVPGVGHQPNPLARPKGEARDLRIIFDAWGGHSH